MMNEEAMTNLKAKAEAIRAKQITARYEKAMANLEARLEANRAEQATARFETSEEWEVLYATEEVIKKAISDLRWAYDHRNWNAGDYQTHLLVAANID